MEETIVTGFEIMKNVLATEKQSPAKGIRPYLTTKKETFMLVVRHDNPFQTPSQPSSSQETLKARTLLPQQQDL